MSQEEANPGPPTASQRLHPVLSLTVGICVVFVTASAALPWIGKGTQPKVEQARAQAFRIGQHLLRHALQDEPGLWQGPGEPATIEDQVGHTAVRTEVPALTAPDPWGRSWFLVLTAQGDFWVVSAGPDGRLTSDLQTGRFSGDDLGSKIR